MKEFLMEKIQTSQPYTNAELDWLLENIGHPDPTIRDELVYASFAISFGGLDYKRTSTVATAILSRNQAIFPRRPHTKRSFTCLLYCLLLSVDNEPESIYHAFLSTDDHELLFQQALDYLTIENDWSGYDEKLGWIHTAAHGADFLLATSCHDQFPLKKAKKSGKLLSLV